MLKRYLGFGYGLASYAIFLAAFLYAIGFIGNFFVPRSIDGEPALPLWQALAIDTLLLGLFAVQHSVMARPAFKRMWTRVVPPLLERSTYVLFSSIALIVLFAFWQPVGGSVWQIDNQFLRCSLHTLYFGGWGLVLLATFLINHFDLFGLRQAHAYLTEHPYQPLRFGTPWLYRHVRHPLYTGWFVVFWATPDMTAAHFLFAVMTSAYILIAVRFEEHDLADMHPEYAGYARRVPRFLPRLTGRRRAVPATAT